MLLADLKTGDPIILVDGAMRTVRAVGDRTRTQCYVGYKRFSLATGKEIGGKHSVHAPAPGEIDEIETIIAAERRARDKEYLEEEQRRAEYEATPHYQLAERIANMKGCDWDTADSWADFFTDAQLEDILRTIKAKKENLV